MRATLFYFLLVLISVFGILLRFLDYDKVPPFDVTKDEFFYPWAGMSLLQTGVPKAWSLFDAYPTGEIVYKWGTWYRIVSPWVEKPPLYSLLAGTWVMVNGAKDLFDVRLSTLRVLPISLSFFTIILVGLLGKEFSDRKVSLLSAFFYATVPTIVMSNRLSLVENLLTPIVLLALFIYSSKVDNLRWQKFKPYFLSFLCGLAVLTKNIGIVLPIIFIAIYLSQRKWKEGLIIGIISFVFALVHPLIGLYYDWNLFLNVLKDYREVHALSGFPELVQTIFTFPIVAHQWDKIFPDGPILAGYILLFSSPFWLKIKNFIVFLGFPFAYISLLALLESGGGPFNYFGWHVYPLFPFLAILLAKALHDLWQKPNFLQSLFFYLILGSSTVRFFLLLAPELQKSWQAILALFLLMLSGSFVLRPNYQRLILTILFAIFLIVNILVVINLNQIYPGSSQPLQ